MKTKMKSVIALVLLCVMLLPISGCGLLNYTPNYDKMIESFVPSPFNTETLSVGDIHGPQARIWLKTGLGTAYSSNENVVTVSDLGKVTAVAPGECYVVITAMFGKLFEVYHYTVK